GDARRRDGAQRRRAAAVFEDGALAEDRARPELAQRFAVDLDRQHTVEQQVELATELTLLDEHPAPGPPPDLGLLAAAHDRGRELALERSFDRGDERGRVLVAPR